MSVVPQEAPVSQETSTTPVEGAVVPGTSIETQMVWVQTSRGIPRLLKATPRLHSPRTMSRPPPHRNRPALSILQAPSRILLEPRRQSCQPLLKFQSPRFTTVEDSQFTPTTGGVGWTKGHKAKTTTLMISIDCPREGILKYPNLGSSLNQLVASFETGGSTAEEAAQGAALHQEESVAVTIYLSGNADDVVKFLEDNGGYTRNVGEDYIETYVPVALLGPVSEYPGVTRVREIVPPQKS